MLKRIALGMSLLASLLCGSVWADGSLNNELENASYNGDKKKVEELIAKGADINTKDNDGNTPLILSIENKKYDVAKLLIAKGADVNVSNNVGNNALLFAFSNEDTDLVKQLVYKGAVNAKNKNGDIALLGLAERNNYPERIQLMELLITNGADVNAKDDRGSTPLYLVIINLDKGIYNGYKEVIELLIAKGANLNAMDDASLSPWIVAHSINDEKAKQEVVAMMEKSMAKDLTKKAGTSHVSIQKLLANFKGHSDNEVLRMAIINLALKLKPAPATPPEAEDAAGRAAYIFKNAKSDDDTLGAAKEYLKAIELAPWVVNYYFNLCTVLEKTPYTQQALHACKLYLTAAPNAADAAEMQQHISGLQYAVDKSKEQMKQRTHGIDNNWHADDLYRLGGLSELVSGKKVSLKLSIYWQDAPPKYQVLSEREESEANRLHLWVSKNDLVSTDTWLALSNVSMHLVIKPDGGGYVQLGDANTGDIRTTLDELFKLRRKALESSVIVSRNDKTYVAIIQGGNNNQDSGWAIYESDCNGNPLHQDARALPDDFVTVEMNESGKSPYSSYGTSCSSQFTSKTGYSFGKEE